MTSDEAEKYVRLPLLEPSELNPEQREVYDQIAETMLPWAQESGFQAEGDHGRLLGPFNAYLYSPELGAAQMKYLQAEQASTELEARTREVVILTVGAVCQSGYELYAHRAVAAKAGLAAEDIEALATGAEPKSLSADELTAHRFVRSVTAEHKVSPELFAEAQKAFGHKGLVDMLHLAGLYMTVSAMLNAFAVPVP